MQAQEVINSPVTAKAVAGATAAAGIEAIWFNYLHDLISLVAVTLGACLSAVLIYGNVKKGTLERQEIKNRIKLQEKELNQ